MKHMDEMKTRRNLAKEIEQEYDLEYDKRMNLAETFFCAGIMELTDEIKARIAFLKQVCEEVDFAMDALLISYCTADEFRERYNRYVFYTGNSKCRASALGLSSDKANAYIDYFSELGLDEEQLHKAVRSVVKLGNIAKSEDDARRIVSDLDCFNLAKDKRNQFVCDHASWLFNDYSRKSKQLFHMLCEKYGAIEGFARLEKHPEWIRLGEDA